jgi:pimeloyl-ACP methyl ester carboxylesterase
MAVPVLLLHGLLMRRPALLPLALRLRQRGFAPAIFAYSTLWRTPEQAMARLAATLAGYGEQPVHVVAHSLGGLIAVETLNRHPGLPPGRLVCLGSPLAGSAAARGLAARRMALVSGRSGGLLRVGLVELPPRREIGMIAGTRPLGLGQLFGGFTEPSDGTVAVSETRLPGLADHIAIPCSHSGLIFSSAAAELVGRFLETGRFR